ncbi:MAG: hypothetical protein MEBIL_02875 [Bilophila sp.]
MMIILLFRYVGVGGVFCYRLFARCGQSSYLFERQPKMCIKTIDIREPNSKSFYSTIRPIC